MPGQSRGRFSADAFNYANRRKAGKVKWLLWTYDVWGNARDGYNVNDRFKQGYVYTRGEYPKARELKKVIGIRGKIELRDHEDVIYIDTQNGKPICEIERV